MATVHLDLARSDAGSALRQPNGRTGRFRVELHVLVDSMHNRGAATKCWAERNYCACKNQSLHVFIPRRQGVDDGETNARARPSKW